MKPIKLKFSGINSFIKEQQISFNEISNGVFGIFGKTGSGKTTILDSIMLALYGQISKNTKAVDFINSKSEEAKVELVFETGEANKKQYFVERRYRKRKDQAVPFASFGEINGENKYTLAEGVRDVDRCIKDVIGLSYGEFSKCIALPQGEFAGFLNATSSERTEILSNIFSLQEYGDKLVDKIKEKYSSCETKRQVLESQKEVIKIVNQQDITNAENELENKRAYVDLLINKKGDKEKVYSQQQNIKNLIDRKNETYKELTALYQQKNEYKELKLNCEKQKRALGLASDIKKVEELSLITKDLKEKVEILNKQKNESLRAYSEFVGMNESFKKNYQVNLIELSKREAVLQSASDDEMIIINLKNEKDSLSETIEFLNEELTNIKGLFNKQAKELESLEISKKEASSNLEGLKINEDIELSLKEIRDIESEIIIYENLERQVSALIDSETEDQENLQIQYTNLVKKEKELNEKLSKTGVSISDILSGNFGESFKDLRENQQKLLNIKDIKQQIAFIDELIEGKKLNIEEKKKFLLVLDNNEISVSKELENIEKQLANSNESLIETAKNQLQQYKSKTQISYAQIKAEISFINQFIKDEITEISKLTNAKDKLFLKVVDNNSYRDENFKNIETNLILEIEKLSNLYDSQSQDRKNAIAIAKNKVEIGTRISMYKESKEKLLDLLFGLQKYRAEHELAIFNAKEKLGESKFDLKQVVYLRKETEEKLRSLLEQINKIMQDNINLERLISQKNAEISSFKTKLENVSFQINQKEEKLKLLVGQEKAKFVLNRVQKELFEMRERDAYVTEKENKLKQDFEKNNEQYKITTSILTDKASELSDLSFELSGRVFKLGFKDLNEAKLFLVEEDDIIKNQNKIDNYKQLIVIKEKELAVINEELGDKTISLKEYELLEKELNDITININEENILIGTIINSLSTMKEDYYKLKKIEQELPLVIKELDDAKELLNILRGKALVEFIAEEYMEVITLNASEKLNMLMGGRYELAFVNQEFVVYDNFNDHIPRVVKTLSGGETFLVSLALALAISETISFSSNKNMEFFFLDEGFGTLDEELVESVISALYKLESHNLNIGLITHVKELEEKIKNKIIVTKATDSEGSFLKIEYNL